jgi:D-amino-acid dehydrogenase
MQTDSIVLGAGIVGVSAAIHLARRGRGVVLIDRRQPGEETSFGNAGLIQREGVHPRAFPRDLGKLLRYGLNQRTDMVYHPTALPGLVPFLARYWWHSEPQRYAAMARSYAPLIARSITEHEDLILASGASDLIVKEGWYQLYRTAKARDQAFGDADLLAEQFGIGREKLDGSQMRALQPGLVADLSGAVHWTDPWSIRDPNALVQAYLRYFEQLGGVFQRGDAMTLSAISNGGWRVETADGSIEAGSAVVAMGPWSGPLTRRLNYRLPLAAKRGYHMHYGQPTATPLRHWILDAEPGYLLAPMASGVRLTTGVEFARPNAPKTPVQLGRAEAIARQLLPIGPRLDAEPWMGARPATPDMLPIIGPAPRHKNLWFAFGHAHHGMTLGPATGRLIAELIGGETPFIDPTAFRAERFG